MRRLLVVAAHPDDESLGAGGWMARSTGLGVEVTVVICSAGEASHPRSRTHSPDRLASMRRDEAAAAVASLAPTAKVKLLDLPDGRLTGVPDVLTAEILRVGRGAAGGRRHGQPPGISELSVALGWPRRCRSCSRVWA